MQLNGYEKEHLDILRPLLPECMVLLKSDGTFPLSAPEKVALFGVGARHTVKGGTGSGEVNSRFFVTVEEGLENAGFEITSDKWLTDFDNVLVNAKEQFVKDIKALSKKIHVPAVYLGMGAVMPSPEYDLPLEGVGELAIYVLSRTSGEGNDRDFVKGDILLNDSEKRDILALNSLYKKFLLVLNVGGPVDLAGLSEVKNILLMSQLGVESGAALADVLLGKENPSGKLSASWAFASDYAKVGEFGDRTDTRYKEGIYVGYRYYDSVGVKNEFPFGYGLSFTKFSMSATRIQAVNGVVNLTVRVRNEGKIAGKEVPQLYISCPNGELDKPYQELAAFAKTKKLNPSEEEEVVLTFNMADVASYSERAASFILENGDYILRLGNSSTNTNPVAVLRLSKTGVTLRAKNVLGKPDFADFKPENPAKKEAPARISLVELNGLSIPTVNVEYAVKEPVNPFVEKLSDNDLAHINVGAHDPKGGFLSVIGGASKRVAGAAGETTGLFEKDGFPVIVMSDGPAGIRISRDLVIDSDGSQYSAGNPIPESIEPYLGGGANLALKFFGKKPPKTAKPANHYATAIPIGTAIAQSFNTELAKACGDIVGAEMEQFGINLWLAPALNIQRDIRCGRNFEYYSEDPLLSGKMAAAITLGVQAHKNCGVTIKHFAANNQETNRYGSNSLASERAMREIYLKGFGICIRESHPAAVMTSYNLLNGTHTSERWDLTQDILRREFGFDGIVMTDWVVSGMAAKGDKYPEADAGRVAAAGGDIFMPGRPEDVASILSALKKGTLTREQLLVNASRVYEMALSLNK
ncbi:MAG: glycoside hydrolase family 3 C-terminal domain-containing protein [Lachnospiraceae bacterium]|nr:glycoside hydrolase family 3 C-terminal domain-containing protein [Lachnospiraceae bacterium]